MTGRAMLMMLDQPRKRVEAEEFATGLRAAGFTVRNRIDDPKPGDVLVIWNRMGAHHTFARKFEQAKARVIVAENGFLGVKWRGGRWFALALNHHNGRGKWPQGGPERWDSWGVEIAPMRRVFGGETVLLAQRGISEPEARCPDRWMDSTARRFKARIRRHPGVSTTGPTLEEDLKNASAVVTWSSGAALKAMLLGHQCYYGMPGWIGAPAAIPIEANGVFNDNRLEMFRRLAWAMWSADEIVTGEPFRRLLTC